MPKPLKLDFLGWALETMIGIDIEDLKAKQEAVLAKADLENPTGQPQQLVYQNLMFTATKTRLSSKDGVNTSPSTPQKVSPKNSVKAAVGNTPSSYKSGSKLSAWKIPLAENVDVENPDVAFQLILDYAGEELGRTELMFLQATRELEAADEDHEAADEDRERAFSNKRRIMRAQGGCDAEDEDLVAKLKHMRFDAEERVRHAMKVEKEMDSKLRAAEDMYEAAKRERAIALWNRKNAEALQQEWLERKANGQNSETATSTTSGRSRSTSSPSSSIASSPCPKAGGTKSGSKVESKGKGRARWI